VSTTTVPIEDLELVLTAVADGFDSPVLLVADPDGGADLVVEQTGRILRVDADRTPVLDIRSDVVDGGERGLLGLAYHPDFSDNRLAYVNYTGGDGRTVIEEFRVAPNGTFDPASRKVILEIAQPAGNHNGGMIAFGPDGYLWIGMGDGGGSDDRFGNGQRADTLLGAMVRIAVGIEGVATYAVPPDNPFVDGGQGAGEVWATGLRNPWRFSFDGADVWIADVGQGTIEEVSRAPAAASGLNYGWPIMEGSTCFRSATCDTAALVVPVTEYDHGEGCSITGGYVYRGDQIPELTGQYFYSDYCAGFLRSYSDERGDIDWTPTVGTTPSVSSFGVGGDGELYVISQTGVVYRLERAG
jgi:glucose/arabinose dehydrogenase